MIWFILTSNQVTNQACVFLLPGTGHGCVDRDAGLVLVNPATSFDRTVWPLLGRALSGAA